MSPGQREEVPATCAAGGHEFEALVISDVGQLGVLVGHSRCRRCGVVADEFNTQARTAGDPRTNVKEG
jgi:hypothetical protein